ncbi:hypothetical protein [Pseudoalteromonas sp. MMG022]|uniref:hypothetical protein n=1 Tax=Pseudoalteromonas sp. MMG022 TaxID=2909978 RepID=UPI001F1A3720|nr:hypothetical protein [Pseudoalteromonas sp. MMG022]MCF6434602.1 hypothetical protein [Pseudoalteromonas sp. MMG022]
MDCSIPKIREDIEISLFDKVKEKNRYLVSIDSKNYLVSEEVIGLINRAKSYQLNNEKTNENRDGENLKEKLEKNLPNCFFENQPIDKPRPPFIISVELISQNSLQKITDLLKGLVNKRLAILILTVFCLLHPMVLYSIPQLEHGLTSWYAWLIFIPLFILSFVIHELGHASSCAKFGQKPGGIGFGLYLIFPAFYTDVTNAWKLNKKHRAIVDISGLYFQSLYLIIIDILILSSPSATLITLSHLISITMIHTINPFFKFDGYWFMSDLSGTVNLHKKVKQTIQYYSTITFKKNLKKPDTSFLIITYSICMLLFTCFMIYLLGKLVSAYQVSIPTSYIAFVKELSLSESILTKLEILLSFIGSLLFPMLILCGLLFYCFKMYSCFFICPENKDGDK